MYWGQSDSRVTRVFALNTADQSLIPGILYGPLTLPGVNSEFKAKSNHRVLPGLTQNQNIKLTVLMKCVGDHMTKN